MLEKEEGGRQRAYAVVWKILTNEERVLSYLVRCYRQNTVDTVFFFSRCCECTAEDLLEIVCNKGLELGCPYLLKTMPSSVNNNREIISLKKHDFKVITDKLITIDVLKHKKTG